MATNCVSVHGTYIALEPSLDGKEPTAFKAVVLSFGWVEFSGAGAKSSEVIVAAVSGANLNGTDLELAHLEGANLKNVIGLTQEQINRACVDEKTELPDGLVRPPRCPADIDTKALR